MRFKDIEDSVLVTIAGQFRITISASIILMMMSVQSLAQECASDKEYFGECRPPEITANSIASWQKELADNCVGKKIQLQLRNGEGFFDEDHGTPVRSAGTGIYGVGNSLNLNSNLLLSYQGILQYYLFGGLHDEKAVSESLTLTSKCTTRFDERGALILLCPDARVEKNQLLGSMLFCSENQSAIDVLNRIIAVLRQS